MSIAGRRILVVEDEMMIAMLLEQVLEEEGCDIVKAARVAKAAPLARTAAIDAAILDVNLAGETVYPVAEELSRRGIPFILVTGYGEQGVRSDFSDRPMLCKPFRPSDVVRSVDALLQDRKPLRSRSVDRG